MSKLTITLLFLSSLCTVKVSAYPNFIGYSYSSCLVCHFNSRGGGPLTDYGRALFSQEIAARTFVSRATTDEELAEKSGFLPGQELPYWIRPSLKFRGLWNSVAPESSRNVQRWINMQQDVNVVLALDENQDSIFSYTHSWLPTKSDFYGKGADSAVWNVTRDAYARTIFSQKLLVAVGLMDKAYGIRLADHTSFSRTAIGFGQNDQVHGVYLEWVDGGSWDLGVHYFVGHLQKEENLRQKGFSTIGEWEIGERNRLGLSFASFETGASRKSTRLAIHNRWGFSNANGSSVMVELGLKDDQDLVLNTKKSGHYSLIEGLIKLARGYHFFSTLYESQEKNATDALDVQRWSVGFLTFPFQRTEFRLSVLQTKSHSPKFSIEDQWATQGQLHVSY